MIGIGLLNESPLHAVLKEWYACPGDRLEVAVDGFVIDIVRGDRLIEIQTGNFSGIKRKLIALTVNHPVRLVYPIAREKWIVRLGEGGAVLGRRKSPKHGQVHDLFEELVSFPRLMQNPNFTLEVVLVREEEVRRHDPRRAWRRRGWVTQERRLLAVVERYVFKMPSDLTALIPPGLPEPFTTSDLAAAVGRKRRLAQQMAYCLHRMGVLEKVGKRGNAILYGKRG
ncbi:MAG TPA: hypothetical protein ENJ31_04780, partial [Anaerolineae bacterium]|nr:hypothetical protein [Anaerolineae bacterium]